MKAALIAYGSRGDVQPFVCLGRALADRGHRVEVVAPPDGEDMARAAGLSFRSFPSALGEVFAAEPAQRMLARGRKRGYWRLINQFEQAHAEARRRAVVGAGESADLIVCGILLDAHCRAIAETRDIPIVPVHMSPIVPSRAYAPAGLTQRNLGPLTRAAHSLPLLSIYRAQRRDVTILRRQLGLSAATWRVWRRGFSDRAPCLLGYSQTLFPAPADWSPNMHPAGILRPGPQLRARFGELGVGPDLDEWLQAGPPPIFFGFGGMPILGRRAMHRAVRTALSRLGMRGILAAGWGTLETTGDDSLFVVDGPVDYPSLFPRCAAAVHHGGSGTTAASVGAGIPTLVCSVFAENPFWGARCRALGIGDTFPFAKFDARRLLVGLQAVLDPAVKARAREVGDRVAAEPDGAEAAVAFLERAVTTQSNLHEKAPSSPAADA